MYNNAKKLVFYKKNFTRSKFHSIIYILKLSKISAQKKNRPTNI